MVPIEIIKRILYFALGTFPCFRTNFCHMMATFTHRCLNMKLYKLICSAVYMIAVAISCPPFLESHIFHLVESEALRSYTVVL
nr:MAG TPA: hypothetical protein [Caudoviricetes sp.]